MLPQQCAPGTPGPDDLVVVGESGVDCDGTAWSWGNTNPNLYKTYRREWCEPICY